MKRSDPRPDRHTLVGRRHPERKIHARGTGVARRDSFRRCRARQILELRGSGLWEGDLGEMRRGAKPDQDTGEGELP